MGTTLDVDVSTDSLGMHNKPFLRSVKVEIKLDQLLGFLIPRIDKPPTWIDFKYEELSNFCFDYGCIGHVSSTGMRQQFPTSEGELGPWIQVEGSGRKINFQSFSIASTSPLVQNKPTDKIKNSNSSNDLETLLFGLNPNKLPFQHAPSEIQV